MAASGSIKHKVSARDFKVKFQEYLFIEHLRVAASKLCRHWSIYFLVTLDALAKNFTLIGRTVIMTVN